MLLRTITAQDPDQNTFQAPKKDPKDYDEEDLAFLQKKKQEEAELKAAKEKGQYGCCMHCLSTLIAWICTRLAAKGEF